jgi:hypothetical protein
VGIAAHGAQIPHKPAWSIQCILLIPMESKSNWEKVSSIGTSANLFVDIGLAKGAKSPRSNSRNFNVV